MDRLLSDNENRETADRAATATKRLSGNNRVGRTVSLRLEGVVPVAVELVADQGELGHFLVSHGDTFRIGRGVELALNGEAGRGGRSADQIDDDAIADQRFGTPVHADEREQPVFDLVPFASSRWQVVDVDVDAEFVGQTL